MSAFARRQFGSDVAEDLLSDPADAFDSKGVNFFTGAEQKREAGVTPVIDQIGNFFGLPVEATSPLAVSGEAKRVKRPAAPTMAP